MEVVDPQVALLSNYEVLTLLRELEHVHLTGTKTALRIKKEEETSGTVNKSANIDLLLGEISENLRTVEVEAIQYLSADHLPTKSQTGPGITKLVQNLAPYELTKAEKLQIVNLAPTTPVELYVIVEELEDRLGQRMNEILTHVQSSLPATTASLNGDDHMNDDNADGVYEEYEQWDSNTYGQYDGDAELVQEEFVFDDTGEGMGVEGDLDVNDD